MRIGCQGIFGTNRDEVRGVWRTLYKYNRELSDLYSLQNIIWVIKSRKMRREGHVALFRRGEVYIECWWGNLSERDHFEDPGVYGRKYRVLQKELYNWTCSKSSSFHSWTKMTKKDAFTSSKTVHPLITLEKSLPQLQK